MELGLVIGKKGRDIPPERALEYIAGFTNVIDIAADDLFQGYDQPVKRTNSDFFIDATASWGGKKMDTCCPMGPYLVTKDEILNPYNLLGYTLQNGRQRDRVHTGALLLGYERTIAFYSSFATLYPGDVIHLGTVGVDGFPFDLSQCRSDDLGTVGGEFEGLGRLTVPVRRADAKEISGSAVVRKTLSRGAREIASVQHFSMKKARSFWIAFANYAQCRQTENFSRIEDMPRFLNNPASALGVSGASCTLARRTTNVLISAEVCLVVKKIARNVPRRDAEEYILGYSPMVAANDQSIREMIVEPATEQERNLPNVYGRWGDGYNVMLEHPVPGGWDPDGQMRRDLQPVPGRLPLRRGVHAQPYQPLYHFDARRRDFPGKTGADRLDTQGDGGKGHQRISGGFRNGLRLFFLQKIDSGIFGSLILSYEEESSCRILK